MSKDRARPNENKSTRERFKGIEGSLAVIIAVPFETNRWYKPRVRSCLCQRGTRGRHDMRDRLVTLPPYNPLPEPAQPGNRLRSRKRKRERDTLINVSACVLKYCVSCSTSWVSEISRGRRKVRRPSGELAAFSPGN